MCCRPRSMRASAHDKSTRSPRNCSQRCAISLVAMLNGRPEATMGYDGETRSSGREANDVSRHTAGLILGHRPVDSREEVTVIDEPMGRPGDPCVMVIFGASGDLTKRKLIPALYNLAHDNLLSQQFAVVGSARSPMTNESFREKLAQDMREFATGPVDPELWEWLARRLYYLPGDGEDSETYRRLQDLLTQIDQEHGTPGNYFFYLAT